MVVQDPDCESLARDFCLKSPALRRAKGLIRTPKHLFYTKTPRQPDKPDTQTSQIPRPKYPDT